MEIVELLHSEIQELQNELAIPDSYFLDIYKLVEDLREMEKTTVNNIIKGRAK